MEKRSEADESLGSVDSSMDVTWSVGGADVVVEGDLHSMETQRGGDGVVV